MRFSSGCAVRISQEVREKFINASVALKLAMNFYKLLPEKNSDNAEKGDGESE